ncbi:unnamed protein product [Wuchereria bancrofti]|uniref:PDZ domain-containing protein n=1 Tax=Wuchereria bancrofti TaxID=6293 RepID=A0A3P7GH92_WUCBA|nr:unnamed protein product [Wuchereria bancrofti]
MALELDTTISSVNGSNNDSNGNIIGMVFKTISNHSPSSNDSGFHSDQLQQHQQSKAQRTISRSRGNIKHKPTYVSVFASDPDCSSPLFDEFDRRFAANRPNFLNATLHLPTGDEETCSVPSIVAPLITPSRQPISPSFMNMSVSSNPAIHPETSEQSYLNEHQTLATFPACTFQQEQQHQPVYSTTLSETPAHEESNNAIAPFDILSSNGISHSNRSVQETSVQKSYKYVCLKTEVQKNKTYMNEQEDEKSEASIRESPNDLCSKFQENLHIEAQISNCHCYPWIVNKQEDSLTKSTNLPTAKLPYDNSSEPKEIVETLDTNEQRKIGKQHDDGVTMKHLSAYKIYHLSSDSVTEPLSHSISLESRNASPEQSLMRVQEITVPELFPFKIVSGHDQESCDTNLEGPPLQILFRDVEFEVISQQKPENQLVKIEKCITYNENLESFKNSTVKYGNSSKSETQSDIRKSHFVSLVPATKLNRIISQKPDSLRNGNGSEKFAAAVFEKPGSIVSTKSIPFTRENSTVSKKREHSREIDKASTIKELQTTRSSNEKFERPAVSIAPRRTRDDKPVPFEKLIEKFTKADNGAVPTPKTFQGIAGVIDSKKSTAMRSSSSSAPKVTTLNLQISKKIPYRGSRMMSDRFSGRNSTYVEISRNRFSTTGNATVSRAENLFTKVRASFEKNAESFPILVSHNNSEKKFVSTVEENMKIEKSSNIIRQSEKVEKKSSIITERKESPEMCTSVIEQKPNAKMYSCLSETESSFGIMKGFTFSRFDNLANDDIVGRPLEVDKAEQSAFQTMEEVTSCSGLHKQGKPSEAELMECKSLLDEKFANYDIFKVILKRSANNPEGSIGVILSSAASGDQYISVQRVISGSIADRSDLIEKGDRIFFVQGHSTKQMSATEARTLIKQRTEHVVFVLGRLKTKSSDMPTKPTKFVSTGEIILDALNIFTTTDPDLFNYSTYSEEVILTKGNLGVGLALDGGRGSVFGDRPIVIKRIFEGGSAARSGRIKIGDQVITIDGIDIRGMSYLEATKTLRSRPEGPLKLVILRRL